MNSGFESLGTANITYISASYNSVVLFQLFAVKKQIQGLLMEENYLL